MFDTANTRSADTDALLAIRYFKGANGQAQKITVTLGENIEMQSSFFWVLFFFSLL
jgi:hypothetical protein